VGQDPYFDLYSIIITATFLKNSFDNKQHKKLCLYGIAFFILQTALITSLHNLIAHHQYPTYCFVRLTKSNLNSTK